MNIASPTTGTIGKTIITHETGKRKFARIVC